MDAAEKRELLKVRLVKVKGLEMRLRSQECADAEMSDYLQGCVERARKEIEKGIEWATKEVFWVRRKEEEGEEGESPGPKNRWREFYGRRGFRESKDPLGRDRGDVGE